MLEETRSATKKRTSSLIWTVWFSSFFPQDGQAGLAGERLDVDAEAAGEPRHHAGLEAVDFAGGAVGGEHDLLLLVAQGVEGVEELLLDLGLLGQEMDVVDQEQVGHAEAVAEILELAVLQGVDVGDEELLAGGVDHGVAAVLDDGVGDGLEQVGLAQPGAAVDEERVDRLAGVLADIDRGGIGEVVAIAHHEVLESVRGAAVARLVAARRRRRGRAGLGRLRKLGRLLVEVERGVAGLELETQFLPVRLAQGQAYVVAEVLAEPFCEKVVGNPQDNPVAPHGHGHDVADPPIESVLRQRLPQHAYGSLPNLPRS